jgi:hypothetical protein
MRIAELITRRRRQLYVHSVIYYRFNTSIIADSVFDRWAYELVSIQRDYPNESAACPFADEFSAWDGTTGFDLPYNDWATRKAAELIHLSAHH